MKKKADPDIMRKAAEDSGFRHFDEGTDIPIWWISTAIIMLIILLISTAIYEWIR